MGILVGLGAAWTVAAAVLTFGLARALAAGPSFHAEKVGDLDMVG
ncbi:hypothetical protein ACFFOS_10625 [Nocardioides kongjuensis]|uniref:Uncharacterized protein n=1 Tax=Nocardioides kongjuensis TaxID=349522 RepID=A0A852R9C8_9ACTN|nr:hypothetical protein [Nocardioides kongjuensis]NYD31513.1 hypothetical protein [Nocardioides kongjuensis]